MAILTRARRIPRLESLVVGGLVLFGFRLGARPIGDNSMLTHLRTGVDAVAGRGIPRSDPYSFTAAGHDWVVQSWLPEWTYGWAHSLGGYRLVVIEQALLCGLLALLVVRLARTGSALRTAVSGGTAIGMGAAYWTPRPLLFGLVCMALLVTAVERRRNPWWLVPLAWTWAQCHGSFPLGLLWLVARALGQWLDWKAWPDDTARYVAGFVGGLAASVLSPLGARLLLFPFTVAEKRGTFMAITEWRSPDFQGLAGRFSIVFVAVALVLLLRARVTWRDLVPVIVFLAAGLMAARNLPVAAVVVAPVLGRALRRGDGAPRRRARVPSALPPDARLERAVAATMAAAFGAFSLSVWATSPLALGRFPRRAVSYLDGNGLLADPHRLAHQDFVGNYLTLRYGPRVKVFIDDRYDMFPTRVADDYRALLAGRPEALTVLDRHRIDTVLWDRRLPLGTILRVSDRWEQVFGDRDWVVYLRRP